jgi:hypothetical protein
LQILVQQQHAWAKELPQENGGCIVQVLERVCTKEAAASGVSWIHTKCLYRLSDESRTFLKGLTDAMCSWSLGHPQSISAYPQPRDLKKKNPDHNEDVPSPGPL